MADTKKEIQILFRNYKKFDRTLAKKLGIYGLVVEEPSCRHVKIYNEANGRCTFISLTAGDWRAGRKIAKNVYELLV